MNTPITSAEDLLLTADQLLSGPHVAATPAGRHRGATVALRTALEIAVDRTLEAAVPGLASSTARAKMLCLPSYTAAATARRAHAVWAHMCLGCHYHQYEIGPSRGQVRVWRAEVGDLVALLNT
ncbi:hypothetical protein [Streptomyces aureus]|uniref:hypothetical protein n=1 Tax=Streptomyces aureus TaxID=193461 RepID=UPI00055CEF68|nr:hypothetical protein [Streptomyces aureus]